MNIYLLKENIDFKEIINERMKRKSKVRISFRRKKTFLTHKKLK
jgi:hypothetical protein